jgi:cation:H+ antiporter
MLAMELQLLLMLLIILAAAILFSNALEYVGHRMGVSAGVTGSIFAAVATALPETTIPIVALIAGTADTGLNQNVSLGAILGAPFMISTLSVLFLAIFALKKRGLKGRIQPEKEGFIRDLNFFILAFCVFAVALYLPLHPLYWRGSFSAILVILYFLYLQRTFQASPKLVNQGHGILLEEPLILAKLGLKTNKTTIGMQVLLGLGLLFWGARGFIQGVEVISRYFNISALLLSILIIPLTTELPEKVNSILWVRKNKDTLAFSNLTGAMVFQGTLLPALGVLLSAWQPNKEILLSVILTLLAAAWLRFNAFSQGLKIKMLFVNGLIYLLYLGLEFLPNLL